MVEPFWRLPLLRVSVGTGNQTSSSASAVNNIACAACNLLALSLTSCVVWATWAVVADAVVEASEEDMMMSASSPGQTL